MAALAKGEVVSRKSSRYVLKRMRPVKSQRWGLGRIDATAFKGGWLTSTSETRQMGIVEDYAVAIITNGVGKARLQSDGDWAHTHTMNRLARKLERRLSRLTATS